MTVVRPGLYGPSGLARCDSCGTEVLDPQPSDERLATIYSKNYYAPWGLDADRSVERMKLGTFEWILDRWPLPSGASVLDLGCAAGFLLQLAAERGFRVHGIDLNPVAVKQCRQNVPEALIHCGTLADQPFADTSFDAVYMIDFLEHVRGPRAELSIVRQRLSSAGAVVISLPRLDSWSRKVMGLGWSQYREEHITYFTRRGLVRLLEETRFRVVDTKRTRKVITLGYVYRQLQHYRHPVLTPLSAALWRLLPFVRSACIPVTIGEMTVVAQAG
jgi:2-polyprenyl-3-methyl-5-hydroxy-6-metoxy-1,4-benzoquinol methylase